MTDCISIRVALEKVREAEESFGGSRSEIEVSAPVSAAMLTEIDIDRSANDLIHEHGEDADLQAAMRADAVLETGDSAVC